MGNLDKAENHQGQAKADNFARAGGMEKAHAKKGRQERMQPCCFVAQVAAACGKAGREFKLEAFIAFRVSHHNNAEHQCCPVIPVQLIVKGI